MKKALVIAAFSEHSSGAMKTQSPFLTLLHIAISANEIQCGTTDHQELASQHKQKHYATSNQTCLDNHILSFMGHERTVLCQSHLHAENLQKVMQPVCDTKCLTYYGQKDSRLRVVSGRIEKRDYYHNNKYYHNLNSNLC